MGKASQAINGKYILLHTVLYYLSMADSDKVVWLYTQKHLRKKIIQQYHDNNGPHGNRQDPGSNQNKIQLAKYVHNLYQYITSCVTCQTRK